MNFEEKKKEVVSLLNSTLTKDSTKEQIEIVKNIQKGIDDLAGIHTKVNKDYEDVKTLYIDLVKSSGNKDESITNDDEGKKKLNVNDPKELEKDMEKYLKENSKE